MFKSFEHTILLFHNSRIQTPIDILVNSNLHNWNKQHTFALNVDTTIITLAVSKVLSIIASKEFSKALSQTVSTALSASPRKALYKHISTSLVNVLSEL